MFSAGSTRRRTRVCRMVETSSSIARPFAMLRCRTRLLPSGSKGRFGRMRTLLFITAIRGGEFFDPYQRLGGRADRPPSPVEPSRPFLRDDPDDIWQVAAALAATLLHGEQPKP